VDFAGTNGKIHGIKGRKAAKAAGDSSRRDQRVFVFVTTLQDRSSRKRDPLPPE
jgi:hypothetical protein